jgi:hypothetical protein
MFPFAGPVDPASRRGHIAELGEGKHMTGTIATVSRGQQVERKLNVRRDTLDFRDRMFEATLSRYPPIFR